MSVAKKQILIGIDEAGRGPLAGPLVAWAVAIEDFFPASFLKTKIKKIKIRDSKKMTAKQREIIYQLLKNSPCFRWGRGIVSEKTIDKINIFQATKLAMRKAVNHLLENWAVADKKNGQSPFYFKNSEILLLIDGNFKIETAFQEKPIIKGDEKNKLIALASIAAKVERDKIMLKWHKKYPQYGFDKHKGYPTKLHLEMLKKFGPCAIHRKTFSPVKRLSY